MYKYIGVIAVVGVLFLFDYSQALAATINVPADQPTIDAGISAAADGDEVVVAPGTYNENIKFDDDYITLRSSGGAASTIINGNGSFTTIDIKNTKNIDSRRLVIDGFTIQGGKGTSGRGGGISITKSDPTIKNSIIKNNTGYEHGGGILINDEANPTITDNTIEDNTTPQYGGGIYIVNSSRPTISNNTIQNNTATTVISSLNGGGGAGIYVDATSGPTILGNTIKTNIAKHAGGGITFRKGVTGTISNNIITGNIAAYGGGIHLETEGSSFLIRDNTIYSNAAIEDGAFPGSGYGGGISNFNASNPTIAGNNIYNNTATNGGGGIVISENATPTISRNRIYGNEVTNTGAIYHGGGIYLANATAYIRNNVIYDNTASIGAGISLVSGSTSFVDHNTIIDNEATFFDSNKFGGGINTQTSIVSAKVRNNIIIDNIGFQIKEENAKAEFTNNFVNNFDAGVYHASSSGALASASALNSLSIASGNFEGTAAFLDASSRNYNILSSSGVKDKGVDLGICKDFDENKRPFGALPDVGAYEYTTLAKTTESSLYRFWSSVFSGHFYTASTTERDVVRSDANWSYEGAMYNIFTSQETNSSPVYRFWSENYKHHFYTISQSERDSIIANDANWAYEGSVYYAYPSNQAESNPVYRFYSPTYKGHFYTTSETEKNHIVANDANWAYEGVAWYAPLGSACEE